MVAVGVSGDWGVEGVGGEVCTSLLVGFGYGGRWWVSGGAYTHIHNEVLNRLARLIS